MKMAIEMFSMVIVITLSCILFSSIISSENQNAKARDFYNVVVNRIEDSNCDTQVIAQCRDEAAEAGYELNVANVTVYREEPSYFVTLGYVIKFPINRLFGGDNGKHAIIEGYAR